MPHKQRHKALYCFGSLDKQGFVIITFTDIDVDCDRLSVCETTFSPIPQTYNETKTYQSFPPVNIYITNILLESLEY